MQDEFADSIKLLTNDSGVSARPGISFLAVLKTVVRVWAVLTEGALLPPIGGNALLQIVPSNRNFSVRWYTYISF